MNIEADPAPELSLEASPAASLLARLRRVDDRWWLAATTAVMVLLTSPIWPIHSPRIAEGLDPSWRIALHQIVLDDLIWGTEVMNTLGPLGFAAFPMLTSGGTAWISIAASVALQAFMIWVTLRALRRGTGWIAGIVGTYLVTVLAWNLLIESAYFAEAFAAAFGLLCFDRLTRTSEAAQRAHTNDADGTETTAAIDDEPSPQAGFRTLLQGPVSLVPRDVLAGLAYGSLAAVMMLIKLSTGTQAAVVGALTIAAVAWIERDRDRFIGMAGGWFGGLVASYLIGWILLGQPVGNLPGYLTDSLEMMSGYAVSNGVTIDDVASKIVLGSIICLLALAAGVARWSGRWTDRIVALAPLAAFLYFTFKLGFVRTDVPHIIPFFVSVGVIGAAFAGRRHTILAVVIVALGIFGAWDTTRAEFSWGTALGAGDNLEQTGDYLQLLTDGDYRDLSINVFRNEVRQRANLTPDIAVQLAGTRVHIDPVETSILFAHDEFVWAAPPVFQSYLAYTPRFDEMNAAWLRDDERAPQYILRELRAIDRRSPAQEGPEYMIEMLCRYREVGTTNYAQNRRQTTLWVLERTPDRCGEIFELERFETAMSETTRVKPDRDDCAGVVVFAVEGMETRRQAIRALIFKDADYGLWYRNQRWQRFLPGTAAQWHLLPNGALPAWMSDEPSARDMRFETLSPGPLTADELEVTLGCLPITEMG